MNWIILIVAGFCEVGFTYCLGRAKSVDCLGRQIKPIDRLGYIRISAKSFQIYNSKRVFRYVIAVSGIFHQSG